MSKFFRLGAQALKKQQSSLKKEHTSANLVGAMERHGMDRALEVTPTAQVRKELEAAGVALPSDAEVIYLSKLFNSKLEQVRHDSGKAKSSSWYNLFKVCAAHTLNR